MTPPRSPHLHSSRGTLVALVPPAVVLALVSHLVAAQNSVGSSAEDDEATTLSNVPFASEPEWAGNQEDFVAANNALSEMFRQALEGDGRGGDGELVMSKQLPDLYYHEEKYRITVSTEHVAVAVRADWQVLQTDVFLEQQHADVEVVLPRVQVTGRYLLDRKAHGDFKSREEGVFRLELRNVSARGLAELRVARGALVLGRVMLKQEAQEELFERTRELYDVSMRDFVEDGALETGLQRRVYREVTKVLEEAVRARLRPAVLRRRLNEVLPSAKDRRLLMAYEELATESADGFVDLLLNAARQILTKNDSNSKSETNRIPIPDLREGFERKIVMVTIRGGFVATQGWAQGLSSAHRRGDAFFAHHANGSGFNLWGGVAFDDLSLTYEHYEAHVMGIGPSGTLTAEVYPLALHVHVRVDFDADRAYLEEFRIDEAGDMQVEVTGLGFVLNWLASKIASWLLGAYRDRVVDELQGRYSTFFADTLDKMSLDSLVSEHEKYTS